jgi:hypothetical protein
MSRKNNVNLDYYKSVGRDRPGEDVVHDEERRSLARARPANERRRSPLRARPTRTPDKRAEAGGEGEQQP